jgi:hypothetical protein
MVSLMLEGGVSMVTKTHNGNPDALIWTEGKTDWKHLKKAAQKLGLCLNISFRESEEDQGDEALVRKCEVFAQSYQLIPMIFVFDRDNESIMRRVADTTTSYKKWGNNVFSFAISAPNHREGYENICIELYYSDDEIKTVDSKGRRLFLTSEFKENSGAFKDDPTIHIGNVNKLKNVTAVNRTKIVDSEVYDKNDVNIALSKTNFADYVYNDVQPFSNFDFEEFGKIFDVISEIILITRPQMDISLPDLRKVFAGIRAGKSLSQQFGDTLTVMFDALGLTMQLFAASTIRCYEDIIVSEPSEYSKKVRPLKRIVSAGLCPSTEAKNLENRLIFKAKLPFLHVVGFAPMSINPCTLQKQA